MDETIDRSAEESGQGAFPRKFGPFTLHRELGRGGMGIVYEATDERLDRRVALKVLRTELSDGSRSKERFLREGRACAKVRHENVVEIYGAEQIDGRPCYSMTLLDGRTLADLARAGELPSREELFRGLATIADALAAIHELGIVHRDVTPGNIMVEPDGRMILADFGLARLTVEEGLTQTGEALGTPYYMSPEQALGEPNVDGRTDLYALGATLYEVLSGRRPFVADDTGGLLQKILKEPPAPIADRVPDLPADATRVVMKALEKRPADRYPDAAAMRDDLLALAEGRPVAGRPVSPIVRGIRRHRKALVAALVCLVVVGGYVIWRTTRPARLELLSWPAATVLLDGREVGQTPMKIPVDPGDHEVVMRLPGFADFRRSVRLEAGDNRTIERVLTVKDPRDADAIEALAASMDVPALQTARTLSGDPRPAGTERPVPAAAPVLTEDLKALLSGSMPLPPGAKVEIQDGEQILVVREGGEKAGGMSREQALEALSKLAEGKEIQIRWSSEDGPTRERLARIVPEVPEPVRQQIEALEKRLEGHDPQVICELKTRIYLAHGLPLAALREACNLDEKGLAGPHTKKVIRLAMERLREGE